MATFEDKEHGNIATVGKGSRGVHILQGMLNWQERINTAIVGTNTVGACLVSHLFLITVVHGYRKSHTAVCKYQVGQTPQAPKVESEQIRVLSEGSEIWYSMVLPVLDTFGNLRLCDTPSPYREFKDSSTTQGCTRLSVPGAYTKGTRTAV